MVNIDELNEKIKKFSLVVEKVEGLPEAYTEIKSQANEIKKNIEMIDKLQSNQAKHIKKINEGLSILEKELSQSIESTYTKTSNEITSLTKTTKSDLQNIKNDLCEIMDENQTTINKRFDSINGNIRNTKNKINDVKTQVESLDNKIDISNDKTTRLFTITIIVLIVGFIVVGALHFI